MCLEALELAPANSYFYALHSIALFRKGKTQDALLQCERAIQMNPDENLFRRILILMAILKWTFTRLFVILKITV
jgi:tetratricopeptide (TPR) repeat protein